MMKVILKIEGDALIQVLEGVVSGMGIKHEKYDSLKFDFDVKNCELEITLE
jgi:hypothetical protein